MLRRYKGSIVSVCVGAGASVVGAIGFSSLAYAEGEVGIAAIFAAVDLSTVSASVEVLAVTIVGIGLLFAGLILAKRIMGKV